VTPVKLIKLIGDAAMLVSDEVDAALEAAFRLVDSAAATDEFPQLRAGVARGSAFRHAGDWYGNTVNLASRVTDAAPGGAVLATQEIVDAAAKRLDQMPFGDATLKGIDHPVLLSMRSLRLGQRARNARRSPAGPQSRAIRSSLVRPASQSSISFAYQRENRLSEGPPASAV
jgi:class 3 adenylate cyclase